MNSAKNVDFSKRKNSVTDGVAVLAIGLAAVFAAYVGGAARAARADAKPTKTTQDGVYTDDQAKRGKAQYSQNCANCHMDDLSGSGEAQGLVGDAFAQTWEGQTVDDLFELTYTTMPPDQPGKLSPDATLDVVAYLLQVNQFPAGKNELKHDPDALKNILISTKKTSQ
ncbi:MAG: cytochrome c [Candidatus Acidiferrales bacterium]|jgi:mono/diheme cytochrome c family protein